MNEKFVVSVAKAIIIDPTTDQMIAYANALADSAFTLAMESQEIRGGINNALKFNYKNTRTLTVNLTNVTFSKAFLPINLGQDILNTSISIANEQCIILDTSGGGTLEKTPTGPVSYLLSNGSMLYDQNTSHSTTVALGSQYAGQKIIAVYDYTDVIDNIVVDSSTPPNIVRLVMNVQIRDNKTMDVTEWLQIDIPSFQPDGNYELSMTADGVSQETLSGTALSVNGESCAEGDVYAYIKFIPVNETGATISAVAAYPSPLSVNIGSTGQINAVGLRGGSYAPIVLTDTCNYAMGALSDADITVNPTSGVVSVAGTATSVDTGTVVVSYSTGNMSFSDTVLINVTEP